MNRNLRRRATQRDFIDLLFTLDNPHREVTLRSALDAVFADETSFSFLFVFRGNLG